MKTLAISALMIVLWTAAPAYAQDPRADAYGGAGALSTEVGTTGGASVLSTEVGTTEPKTVLSTEVGTTEPKTTDASSPVSYTHLTLPTICSV